MDPKTLKEWEIENRENIIGREHHSGENDENGNWRWFTGFYKVIFKMKDKSTKIFEIKTIINN